MSSSTGSGIGIGGIIFMLVVGYNLFFDDDDEDKKDVDSKKDKKPAISETTKKSIEKVKEDAKKAINSAKQALTKVIEDYKKNKTEVEDFSDKEESYVEKETIVVSEDPKKLIIESADNEHKENIPSLQISNKGPSEGQPTFRTIE